MPVTSGQTTVECPRCGTRSAGAPWCTKCGRRLSGAASGDDAATPIAAAFAQTDARTPAPEPTTRMQAEARAEHPTISMKAESGPPPPAMVAYPASAWEEPPDRRNLYIALAAVAIVVIVLLVVLLGRGGGSPSPSIAPESLVQPVTPEQTTPTTSEQTPVSAASVESLLTEYESDYSGENAQGLRGLFSEDLTRKDGSKPPEDLEEAINTYEKQFSELKEPSYTLSNIEVQPATAEATAKAAYSITSQNGRVGGAISFHLVEQEQRLLIDSITVTPSK
jgi:hypothetical protein